MGSKQPLDFAGALEGLPGALVIEVPEQVRGSDHGAAARRPGSPRTHPRIGDRLTRIAVQAG